MDLTEDKKMNETTEVGQVKVQTSMQDHFEITYGTPSKGSQVTLKTYYNSLEIDDAQKRIENTLKIRQYLMDKGIIQ